MKRTRYIYNGPGSCVEGPPPYVIIDTVERKLVETVSGREAAERRVDELNGGKAK